MNMTYGLYYEMLSQNGTLLSTICNQLIELLFLQSKATDSD